MNRKPWQLQLKIDSRDGDSALGFRKWTTVRRYRFEKRARQALNDVTKGRVSERWNYRLLRDECDGPATAISHGRA